LHSSQKFAHHSLLPGILELLCTKVWEENTTGKADLVNEVSSDFIWFAATTVGAPDLEDISPFFQFRLLL
jgi:hypothetical protein